jgi:putative hydrolase of the HAD superfamily
VRRGEISFTAALTEIAQAVGARVDPALVERLRQQRIEEKADVYERVSVEIRTLVDSLANRGVALAVISNGFDEEAVAWRASRFSRSFPCSIFSSSEGVAKPDPAIYRRALDRMGVDPDKTVYVGDGGDHELEGAERAGLRAWRAAWFVRDPPGGTCTAPELTAPAQVLRALESVVRF